MRSLGFTLVLAITAACICIIAAFQWREGNFDAVFGKPATPIGERLYDEFTAEQVKHIFITANDIDAKFTLEPNGWQATRPWQDRMDPRSAVAIINFTLGMRVEDYAPTDKVNNTETGLGKKAIRIRLTNTHGQTLANYKMGRVSPWKAEVEDIDQPINTVFIEADDEGRKDYAYICTGDITQLFTTGLQLLRDHRPFYFNPTNLQKISIRSTQGELTLGREKPGHPWRIVKPLDLATNPQAMKNLIEGLFSLRAVQVRDRSDVTLPATDQATNNRQIAITRFGSKDETMLDIYPPDTPEATQTVATLNSRPNTIFDLPTKPTQGTVSLADLPLDVNTLRDPTLTHLNIAALQSIAIQPSTGQEIVISKEDKQPWMVNIGGQSFIANEAKLFKLLKTVTATHVIGFESDAATDFSPWGLDKPFLKLRFLAINNEALEIRFGMNTQGDYFVNRLGTPTVMKVDPLLVKSIAVHPFEWKHARLWSINRFNLLSLVRQKGKADPIDLRYDFGEDKWTAEQSGEDISAKLINSRASFMLEKIEGLETAKWLARDDSRALAALTEPSLSFNVIEKSVDDDGNDSGVLIRTLILAPTATPDRHGYYYGIMNRNPHPFLISSELYEHLSLDLLEE